ncbi:MAG: hypothetical protein JJE47_12265 [Acidimicrobiia bacterium]|nr:hypothetical protein [Acidimicrobiia bacterium]
MELDDLLNALATVQRDLQNLPEDSWADRYRLQTEQDRLRTVAEALRSSHDPDEGLSDEALVAEAASLRKRMESMATRTGGLVTSKGGGSSSPSSGAMAELQFKSKQQQAGEIERMAVRVNQIDQALKRRQTL